MEFMVKLELFEKSDGRITCLKMLKRFDQSMSSNAKFRQIIQKAKINHDSVMTQSCQNHDSVMQEEKRLEEIRREENKPLTSTLHEAEVPTSGNKRKKPIPFLEIQKIYNAKFGHEQWARSSNVLTEKTERQIRKIAKHLADVDQWGRYFAWGAADEWINGTTRDSDWKPNIDYMTREKTFAQLTDKLHDGQKA